MNGRKRRGDWKAVQAMNDGFCYIVAVVLFFLYRFFFLLRFSLTFIYIYTRCDLYTDFFLYAHSLHFISIDMCMVFFFCCCWYRWAIVYSMSFYFRCRIDERSYFSFHDIPNNNRHIDNDEPLQKLKRGRKNNTIPYSLVHARIAILSVYIFNGFWNMSSKCRIALVLALIDR